MEIVYCHIIALIAGFALDKLLGDPSSMPHPVVAFGNMIAFVDQKFNRGKHRVFKGALSSMCLIVFVFLFFAVLMRLSYGFNMILGCALETMFVFFGIAGTTLIREGKAVFKVLEKEGIEQGRKQVARIVGRDTSEISGEQIKKATLETLAENLSDGVVAPLFWYALAGIPGMMTYKMVNTLDSMIGYKNDKYLCFGCFAAKSDDVLNFIPARITALTMALFSMKKKAFQFIVRFGRAHSSPNAGYPEAALAGILNVQFGGTHNYFGTPVVKPVIGENNRIISGLDLKKTIKNMRMVEVGVIVIILAAFLTLNLPVFFL